MLNFPQLQIDNGVQIFGDRRSIIMAWGAAAGLAGAWMPAAVTEEMLAIPNDGWSWEAALAAIGRGVQKVRARHFEPPVCDPKPRGFEVRITLDAVSLVWRSKNTTVEGCIPTSAYKYAEASFRFLPNQGRVEDAPTGRLAVALAVDPNITDDQLEFHLPWFDVDVAAMRRA